MRRFLSNWPFWVLLLLAFFVLLPALPLRGSLGNIDWHIPPFSTQIKEISQANFFVWNDKYLLTGLPMPNPPLWGWLLTAGLGRLPLDGEMLSFVNHFLILFLAGFSSFVFLNYFFKNKLAAFAGAVFYMFSPTVFNWFHIGFVPLLYSYALVPLALLLFVKATADKVRWNYVIAVGLVYGLVGAVQMQSIFLWAILLVSLALFDFVFSHFSKKKLKNYLTALVGVFTLALLINSYWLLQIIIGNSPITQEAGQQIVETMLRLSSVPDLIQGLQLLGFHDSQYESLLRSRGFWGLLIPWSITSLAWLAILFRWNGRNKRIVGYFLLLYVLSVPLTLGYNAPSPIDEIYRAFVKIPLVGILFRGSYKFWLLSVVAFTYLVTATLDQITKMVKFKVNAVLVALFFTSLLTAPFYFCFIRFQEPYRWPAEYRAVGEWLSEQPGEFKAVFLPSENYIFLKGKKTHVADFPNITSPKTGLLGVTNPGITGNNYINFLNMIINEVPTQSLGEFLGAVGVKYIIFQDNVIAKSWETLSDKGPVEEVLKEKLSRQKDLEKLFEVGSLAVYENKDFEPLVYVTDKPEIVSGDFNYLLNASLIHGQQGEGVPIFLDPSVVKETPDIITKLMSKDETSVVIQDDSFIDLVLSRTREFVDVPLGKYALGYYAEDKWGTITNAYFFKNINYTASLYNPILAGATEASFSGQLKAPFATLEDNGPYLILIKAYVGPKASKISLALRDPVKDQNIFEERIDTFSARERGFRWFRIDDFPLGDFNKGLKPSWVFTADSFSGENALERVILIPKDEFLRAKQVVEEILLSGNIVISTSSFNTRNLFIPREGDYNLLVKFSGQEQNDNLVLRVDAEELQLSDGVLPTPIHLTKGEHRFAFDLSQQPKILEDPSFEFGLWSGVLDSNPSVRTPALITSEQASDAADGVKSLKLVTRSVDHAAAVCQPFSQFNNSSLYFFSFDYKGEKDTGDPRFAFWQNVDKRRLPQWPAKEGDFQRSWTIFGPQGWVPRTGVWARHEGVFEPFTNARVAGLCFFTDPWGARQTVNFYDNVQVEEIPFASVVLKWDKNDPSEGSKRQVPKTSFVKRNPAEYEVQIEGASDPFILVLSESFNPGWRLSLLDKGVNLDGRNHFKINGFANAWYLEEEGSYRVRLQFWPQKFFFPGLLVSGASVLGGLIFLGYFLLKKGKA